MLYAVTTSAAVGPGGWVGGCVGGGGGCPLLVPPPSARPVLVADFGDGRHCSVMFAAVVGGRRWSLFGPMCCFLLARVGRRWLVLFPVL